MRTSRPRTAFSRGLNSNLRHSWAIGLFVASVLAGAAFWGIGALLVGLSDHTPSGPACDWEIDEGSGPGGSGGREEIRWGYFTARYCVVERPDGFAHEDFLGGALITPLGAPLIVFAVALIGRWLLVRFVPESTT